MPDIEVHGLHCEHEIINLRSLLHDAPYADDFTVTYGFSKTYLLISGKKDAFLRIYGSPTWVEKYKADLLARLSPHYGVEIVPIEWYPRRT